MPIAAPQEVILLAATGMSPAVLSETVWALANEEEPIIPDRVILLTTTRGRDAAINEFLKPDENLGGSTVWDDLRSALRRDGHDIEGKLRFGTSGSDIRVFTAYDARTGQNIELDDIRTSSDNEAVADFVLETIRAFVENPETHLIASIAGGRKTAGILVHGCMMLIGRESDRLVHVLVNSPFDSSRLQPRFYFPGQSMVPREISGKEFPPSEAQIELADIPFVPLRNSFVKELGRLPGKFTALTEACREAVNRNASAGIRLGIWRTKKVISISGNEIDFGPREQLVFLFLAHRATNRENAIDSYAKVEPLLEEFRISLRGGTEGAALADWRYDIGNPLDAREITHALSEIRSKLRRNGAHARALVNCLPVRGRFSLDLQPEQIDVHE